MGNGTKSDSCSGVACACAQPQGVPRPGFYQPPPNHLSQVLHSQQGAVGVGGDHACVTLLHLRAAATRQWSVAAVLAVQCGAGARVQQCALPMWAHVAHKQLCAHRARPRARAHAHASGVHTRRQGQVWCASVRTSVRQTCSKSTAKVQHQQCKSARTLKWNTGSCLRSGSGRSANESYATTSTRLREHGREHGCEAWREVRHGSRV